MAVVSELRGRLKSASKVARLSVETGLTGARSLLLGVARGAKPPPRDPYVQSVSACSAVIAWISNQPNVGIVEYGKNPQLGCTEVEGRSGRRHAVTLSGLEPSSTYYYRVVEDGRSSAKARFRTAPGDENPCFTFAVIGDSGNGKKNQLAVAGLLERLEPDFILHTGDVVYPSGKDRHYDRRFFGPYGRLIREVPIFPTLGNHDVERKNGAAYLKNFHLPCNNPRGTGRYYSFDWGNAHFVALNSELYYEDDSGDPEEQKEWLERDLEETRQSWKIVYLHRPPYSSSKHGSDKKIRKDLGPVFVRYGVNVAFSGHDHHYERTVPIKGVTYVVSGGGGKRLYRAGRSAWTASSQSVHHAVYVRVEGEHLSLEAIKPDGMVLDRLDLGREELR
ncbi:MAG TPA: metallophosphoesterase family protein [Rubrobacteraceae bacterium]|nr:metallophosphoesterase family protein [Rubrobacteraceae bacterium]